MTATLLNRSPVLILVSPKGERNVGAVARAMGNFGFGHLRIVAPRCDYKNLEAKKMSMRAFSILESAQEFPNLAEAQADCHLSIAFTGRAPVQETPFADLFDFASEFSKKFTSEQRVAFVFGREEWGFELDELAQCDLQVGISTTLEAPSLNLASAVSVVLATFFKFNRPENNLNRIALDEMIRPPKMQEEVFFRHFFEVLELSKFTNPQNPERIMNDVRNLYHRASVNDRDFRILFGILTCVRSVLLKAAAPQSSSKL